MISNNLFQNILVEPARNGCNKLLIASGYATSAMAFHHLNFLRRLGFCNVEVNLIIGMSPTDGISLSNHSGFQQIMNEEFEQRFQCSYRFNTPPFHSKLYIWKRNNEVYQSFLGSANYTQTAFNEGRQMEVLTECSNEEALDYFNGLIGDSIYCTHPESENIIQIYNERYYRRRVRELTETEITENAIIAHPDNVLFESVTVSLLDRYGNLPQRSGLNWGQRPEEGREPNQAYIRLTSDIYRSDFFPPREVHFTLLTDDNKVLICTYFQTFFFFDGGRIHQE